MKSVSLLILALLLTTVTVDSSDLEPFSLNDDKKRGDSRFVLAGDKDRGVVITEDGEPAFSTRY